MYLLPQMFCRLAALSLVLLVTTGAHLRNPSSLSLEALPQQYDNQCGYKYVRIDMVVLAEEIDICNPLSKVISYFDSMGFKIEPRFSLALTQKQPVNRAEVYGYLNPKNRRILIFLRPNKNPWNLNWNKEILDSILIHEFVHMAILQTLKSEYLELPKEWHEFIAYALQIDFLYKDMRHLILYKYAHIEPFENLLGINPYSYGMTDPDIFSVRAYKTFRQQGGSNFLQKLLQLEFRPPKFFDLNTLE